MSRGDVKIISGAHGSREADVDDRNTSGTNATIKPGEPLLIGGAGSNFMVLPVDGRPIMGTNLMYGVNKLASLVLKMLNYIGAKIGFNCL